MTQVQVAEFDGPLALLLSLIEARQLDVLTVPLGALADAYLDALATLEADRLGHVSSFVAVASQLILIKSRAMLPRQADPASRRRSPTRAPIPEAELRARLIVYRAHRDAGLRLADEALRRIGLFRREPGAARAAGLAGARPADAPALDPALLVALAGAPGRRRAAARAAARDHGPRDHARRARGDHPGGAPRRPVDRAPGAARAASAIGSSSRSPSWPCSS